MPTIWIMVLAAVVAGWLVQLYLSYQQQMSFARQIHGLRASGTVTVGVAGRRYRGGRAFTALAVDDHGIVRDALTLRGWTTFARGRRAPSLVGIKTNQIKGDREIPGLTTQERDAAREALVLLDRERRRPTSQPVSPSAAPATD